MNSLSNKNKWKSHEGRGRGRGVWVQDGLLGLTCSPSPQIFLVLFPLGVCQVAPLVCVYCEAQLALILSQVVLIHKREKKKK